MQLSPKRTCLLTVRIIKTGFIKPASSNCICKRNQFWNFKILSSQPIFSFFPLQPKEYCGHTVFKKKKKVFFFFCHIIIAKILPNTQNTPQRAVSWNWIRASHFTKRQQEYPSYNMECTLTNQKTDPSQICQGDDQNRVLNKGFLNKTALNGRHTSEPIGKMPK